MKALPSRYQGQKKILVGLVSLTKPWWIESFKFLEFSLKFFNF